MRHRQVVFVLGVAASMCVTNACRSRTRDAATFSHTRLHVQCERRSTALQCQALASDDETTAGLRDVTDVVDWASSDADAVSVRRGRVRANNGGGATVTATLTDAHDAPSASVMVAADVHGETRQAYALEGEVRSFPTAEGVGGVRVILVDESGIVLSAATTSSGGTVGHFRFVPVPAGNYQLRAVCDGYRAAEETVIVPDDAPRTLTLIPEPKNEL